VPATSAAHYAWARTLAALAALPRPAAPLSAVRTSLLPLVAIYPNSTLLATCVHRVYGRTRQVCRLRMDLDQLTSCTPAGTAAPFVLAAAAATSSLGQGGSQVHTVLGHALSGTSALAAALQATKPPAAWLGGDGAGLHGLVQEACASRGCTALSLGQTPEVWQAYLQFLASTGAVSELYDVLVRAAYSVPWCKSVWMRGLHLAADTLAGGLADGLLTTMVEWGVPLATQREEIWEEVMLLAEDEAQTEQDI
jgi:hypothetical protein